MSTIATLTTRFQADTSGFTKGLGDLGRALDGASGLADRAQKALKGAGGWEGAAKIGAAATVGFGVALFKLGGDFQDSYNTIRRETGATGKELDSLKGSMRAVLSQRPEGMEQVTEAIVQINRASGATGPTLENVAKTSLRLASVTKEDLGGVLKSSQGLFQNWGISAEDQVPKLDVLYRVHQKTGVGVTDLAETMSSQGVVLRQLGLGYEESAGMLGLLTKAGVPASQMTMGFNKILAEAAKAGIPARDMFRQTFEAIRNAPDDTAAAGIAVEVFGARAGPRFAALIREGKLSFDDLAKTVAGGSDTINKAADETATGQGRMKTAFNATKVALEPLAIEVFGAFTKAMTLAMPFIKAITGGLRDLMPVLAPIAIGLGLISLALWGLTSHPYLLALGAGIIAFGLLKDKIGPIPAALIGLTVAVSIITIAMHAFAGSLGAVLLPLGVILFAVGAAAAVFYFLKGPLGTIPALLIAVATAATIMGIAGYFMSGGILAATWPILIIIAVVALLIAGIWLLVKNWETVWKKISEAADWWWQTVIKPCWEGMKLAWQAVVDAAKWLWENVLRPAWEGFAAVVSWAWNNVIWPVFQVMMNIFKVVFALTIGPLIVAAQYAFQGLCAAAEWAWNTILRPVIEALGAAWRWVYDNILSPIFSGIRTAFDAVGAAISWVYNTIIKPIIDGLGAAWQWLYDNIIGPVFRWIRDRWQETGDHLRRIYDTIIRPVIDIFRGAIDGLKKGFEAAKDGIATAWDAIRDAVKKPVEFVVNTIINPLIRGANWILEKIGIGKVPEIKMAAGGKVPGVGNGDTVPALLTPGEWVLTKDQAAAIGYANLAVGRFAAGGPVGKHVPDSAKAWMIPEVVAAWERIFADTDEGGSTIAGKGRNDWVRQLESMGPVSPVEQMAMVQWVGQAGVQKKKKGIWDKVGDVAGGAWDAATGFVGDVIDLGRGVLAKAFEMIVAPLRALYQGELSAGGFREVMAKFVDKIITGIADFIRGKDGPPAEAPPGAAKGGVFDRPTAITVGDAGREFVMPEEPLRQLIREEVAIGGMMAPAVEGVDLAGGQATAAVAPEVAPAPEGLEAFAATAVAAFGTATQETVNYDLLFHGFAANAAGLWSTINVTTQDQTAQMAAGVGATFGGMAQFLSDTAFATAGAIGSAMSELSAGVQWSFAEAAMNVGATWQGLSDGLVVTAFTTTGTIQQTFSTMSAAVFADWTSLAGNMDATWSGLAGRLTVTASNTAASIQATFDGLAAGVNAMWGWLADSLTAGWQNMANTVVSTTDWLSVTTQSTWSALLADLHSRYMQFSVDIIDNTQYLSDSVIGAWQFMAANVGQIGDDMLARFSQTMDGMVDAGRYGGDATGRGMYDNLASHVGPIENITKEFARKLVDALNPVLEGVGKDKIELPGGFREGGQVPGGFGGGDRVTARLEPGEYVLQRSAVNRVGVDTLNAVNAGRLAPGRGLYLQGVPGMQGGGYMGAHGPVTEAGQQILNAVPGLSITSGLRVGGTTYHGQGLALDLAGSIDAMNRGSAFILSTGLWKSLTEGIYMNSPVLSVKNNAQVPMGFWGAQTIAGHRDHIHIAISGEGGVPFFSMVELPELPEIPPPGGEWMGGTARKLMEYAREMAQEWVDENVSVFGLDTPVNMPGEVGDWVRQAMAHLDLGGLWFGALMYQISRESGGNPNIIQQIKDMNSGGQEAGGLMQVIPNTYAAFRDPGLPNNRFHPVSNIVAAVRYIFSRYGASANSLGRWTPGPGYAAGAIFPARPGGYQATIGEGGRDEAVIPLPRGWRSAANSGRDSLSPSGTDGRLAETLNVYPTEAADYEILLRKAEFKRKAGRL